MKSGKKRIRVATTSTFHSSQFRDTEKRCQDDTCHVAVYPAVSQSRTATLVNVHTPSVVSIIKNTLNVPLQKTQS